MPGDQRTEPQEFADDCDKWWNNLPLVTLDGVYHRGHSGALSIERSALSFTPVEEPRLWLPFDSLTDVEMTEVESEGGLEASPPAPSLSSWNRGYASTGVRAALIGVPVLPSLAVKAVRRHNQKQRALLQAAISQQQAQSRREPRVRRSARLRVVSQGEPHTFRHGDAGRFTRRFEPLVDRWLETHPTAQETHAPPPAAVSVADELRKLADLRREGILTDEEFESQKARLLTS